MILFGTLYISDIVEINQKLIFIHSIQGQEMSFNKNGQLYNIYSLNQDLLLL